ncbi:helix-turn-helix domain-containing protein [Metabacillus sp. Hm71]|uniref:helix-turn-helix domain-containing protein n=1 Tax=Metabacillus sp. Hm71 TaxID=3450743 RepID=UPI003F43966F
MIKRKKFYWKLFVCMMAVIFVYTAALSFVYYIKNREFTNYELEQSQKELLKQVKEKVDHRLLVALSGINQLKSSKAFENFSQNTNEKLEHYYVNELYKELQKNSNAFSQFEYKLGVMKTDKDMIVTPDMTINQERYFQQLGLNKEENEQVASYLKGKNNSFGQYKLFSLMNPQKDNLYITLLKKEWIAEGKNVVFFLSFYTKNLYPALHSVDQGGFALIEGKRILSHRTTFHDLSITDVLNQDKLKQLQSSQEKLVPYQKITASDYQIKSLTSEVLKDWQYLYITPKHVTETSFAGHLIDSLPVYLLFLLAGLVLQVVFVNYTYQPVKKVLQVLKDGEDSIEGDEFAFIQKITTNMKKMNERLLSTIDQHQMPLKQKFMKDLLLGLVEKEEVKEKLEFFGLTKLKQGRVILFEFSHYKDWEESVTREGILTIKLQLLTYLKEHIEKNISYEMIEMEAEKLAILTSETNLQNIRNWINSFNKGLDERLLSTMFIAISEPLASLYHFEKGYKQARNLLEYRYAIERKNIVTTEDIECFEQKSYYYPLEMEKELINFSCRGQKEKAMSILKTVLNDNLYVRQLDEYALRSLVFELLATFHRILSQTNQAEKTIFGEDETFYQRLQHIRGKEKVEQTITSLFDELLENIQVQTNKTDLSVADQLMSFIHENFQRDLSLSDLAEHFNLTSSYVSRVFKEQTGENFKEYLNMYRVEKAKEILSAQDVKINQVASMVGFNNVNTFIRTFKKYVGLSPGQYEKSS